MAIALVAGQTASAGGTGTNLTISGVLPNNPTNGNFVVALVYSDGNPTTPTVKDANNITYTATTNTPFKDSSTSFVGVYYLPNASGASKTVTFSIATTPHHIGLFVAEFSGVTTSNPLESDNTSNSLASSSTNINLPSITTTNDGDLMVGVALAGQTISVATSPWTGIGTVQNGNFGEYFIQSAHGAQAVGFTQSPAGGWWTMEAAFTAAAAGDTLMAQACL